jgi:hypothetical protein
VCHSFVDRQKSTFQHDTIREQYQPTRESYQPSGGIPRHSFVEECCTRSEGDGTRRACLAGGGEGGESFADPEVLRTISNRTAAAAASRIGASASSSSARARQAKILVRPGRGEVVQHRLDEARLPLVYVPAQMHASTTGNRQPVLHESWSWSSSFVHAEGRCQRDDTTSPTRGVSLGDPTIGGMHISVGGSLSHDPRRETTRTADTS